MSISKFVPDLSTIRSTEGLARALGISTPLFVEVLENTKPDELYRRHEIAKRVQSRLPPRFVEIANTGIMAQVAGLPDYRLVWEPYSIPLKLAHKSTAACLSIYLGARVKGFPHQNSYGYLKGRSTRDNAGRHKGARRLLGADIKNFFPSITIGRVEAVLRDAGIRSDIARSLSKFLTINGELPLGLNSSPLIANLVAHPLDIEFSGLAERLGCNYTRYADDITFSSNELLPERRDVIQIFARNGFEANEKKWRLSKRGQRHYVTGLSVADSLRPHAPRAMKARLRQELFYISRDGLASHMSTLKGGPTEQSVVNRIDGMVSYIASLEPTLALKLRAQWASICEHERVSRSFEPRKFVNLVDFDWFIDESELTRPDGTKVLALACVHVSKPVEFENEIISAYEEEVGDPFSRMASSRRSEFHWSDATPSLREKVAKHVAVHPLRAVIAIDAITSSKMYEEVYCRLLTEVIGRMLRVADGASVTITVEANSSKISEQKITSTIDAVHTRLVERNERRPVAPAKVSVQKKGGARGMSAPDIVLGALAGYLHYYLGKDTDSLRVETFERIRSRVKMLIDLQTGEIFHRNNPIVPWRSASK